MRLPSIQQASPSISPTASTSYKIKPNGNGASPLIRAATTRLHQIIDEPTAVGGASFVQDMAAPTTVRQRKLAAIRAPSVGEPSTYPSPVLRTLSIEPSTPSPRATTPVRSRKRKKGGSATNSVAPLLDSADRRRSGRIAKAATTASSCAEISKLSLFGFSPYLESLVLGAREERRTRSGIRSVRAQPAKPEARKRKAKEKQTEGPDQESKKKLYTQLCILSYQLQAELELVPFKTLEQLKADFATPPLDGYFYNGYPYRARLSPPSSPEVSLMDSLARNSPKRKLCHPWDTSPPIRPSRPNVMSISSIISEPLRPPTPPPQVWKQQDELESEILQGLGLDFSNAFDPDPVPLSPVEQEPTSRYDPHSMDVLSSLDLDSLFAQEEEAYIQERQESSELYVSMRYLEIFDDLVDRWRHSELSKLRKHAQAEKDKVGRILEAEQEMAWSNYQDDLSSLKEAGQVKHKSWPAESELNRFVYQRRQSRAMNKVQAALWGNEEVRRKYGAFVGGGRYSGLQDPRVRADVFKLRRAVARKTLSPEEHPDESESDSDCTSISSLPSYTSYSSSSESDDTDSRPLKRKRTPPPNTRWWKAGRVQ